jgi:hypothetical protein
VRIAGRGRCAVGAGPLRLHYRRTRQDGSANAKHTTHPYRKFRRRRAKRPKRARRRLCRCGNDRCVALAARSAGCRRARWVIAARCKPSVPGGRPRVHIYIDTS